MIELSSLWDILPDYARNSTETWMNAISLSAQHPNSEICINSYDENSTNAPLTHVPTPWSLIPFSNVSAHPIFDDWHLTPLSFTSASRFTTSRLKQTPAAVLAAALRTTSRTKDYLTDSRLGRYITTHSDIKTLGGRVSRSRAVTHIFVIRRSLAMASSIFLSTGSTPCLLMLQLTTELR